MPTLDVKGFNQFQDEILVIDVNLNDEIDPQDQFIAAQVEGLKRGERIDYHHPRFVELRQRYSAFLEANLPSRRK